MRKMSSVIYENINWQSSKEKLIIISPSLASCEGIQKLYREYDVLIITADVQKNLPNNIIILNPDMKSWKPTSTYIYTNNYQDQEPFHKLVSKDKGIRRILEKILTKQKELFVKPITMTNDLSINIKGVKVIGPPPEAAIFWNNKINQRKTLRNKIPLTKGGLYNASKAKTGFLKHNKGKGVFISAASGGGGSTAAQIKSSNELNEFIKKIKSKIYIIDEWIEKKSSPSVFAVIDKKGTSIVMEPVIQMLNNTAWKGSEYLNESENKVIKKLKKITKQICTIISQTKPQFIGVLGIDYIVSTNNEVFFCEINPRFTGNTAENCFANEQVRINDLTILELELLAITNKEIPVTKIIKPNFCWSKERVKATAKCIVTKNIKSNNIKEIFTKKKTGYFNTQKKGTIIPKGHLLATIICVNSNKNILREEHKKAIERVKASTKKINEESINEEPTLFIGAHPDDIAISAGITIMSNPEKSHIITITNGAPKFDIDYPKKMSNTLIFKSEEEYAKARLQDDLLAMKFMGVKDNYQNLNISDQESHLHINKIIDAIISSIKKNKITRIVTHEYPQSHPDHEIAHFCAHIAEKLNNVEVWEYPMYTYNEKGELITGVFQSKNINKSIIKELSDQEIEIKKQILLQFKSQPHIVNRYLFKKELFASISRNVNKMSSKTEYIKPYIREATPEQLRIIFKEKVNDYLGEHI